MKTKSFNYGLQRKCHFCVLPCKNDAKNQILTMIHQQLRLPLVIVWEMKSLKNIIGNLVTLSIPKVVKNGQKVPIIPKYDIWFAAYKSYPFLVLYAWADIILSILSLSIMIKEAKNHLKMPELLTDSSQMVYFSNVQGLKWLVI